jgi:hypothetical protein
VKQKGGSEQDINDAIKTIISTCTITIKILLFERLECFYFSEKKNGNGRTFLGKKKEGK